MDRTQIILGVLVLFTLLTVVAFVLNEMIPNRMVSVGRHVMCSVGWNG